MTDLAAISGQLVDIRNVGTHKCVKLTIHVPAEYAPRVFEAFGWPTGVDPVPVALARMTVDAPIRRVPVAIEKRLVQQAGICCSDPLFQAFLYEHDMAIEKNEECATTAVRLICSVQTRKDIIPGTPAAALWNDLYGKFLAWKLAA